MLIIMENGDVHFLFQTLFNDETFGRLDIFKVYAAKCWANQFNRFAKFIGVLCVHLDVD